MSVEALESQVQLLLEKVDFLEKEVNRLTLGKRFSSTQDTADMWEVVEEERFLDLVPVPSARQFQLEEGPPELPVACKNYAERNLKQGNYIPAERALAAYQTGFWIRIALETYTKYLDTTSLKGLSAIGLSFEVLVEDCPCGP